jgi:hypothetical protein
MNGTDEPDRDGSARGAGGDDRRRSAVRSRAGHLLVTLIALVVYLPAAWWGVPYASAPNRTHAWGVDDETPLGTLSEVYSIVTPPGPNRNLGYPLMYAFTATSAMGPYLGVLRLTGRLETPVSQYPFGFDDPIAAVSTLGLIAHLVTVFFAVLIVIAAFDAGCVTFGRRGGFVMALAAMLAWPMVYYARTGNVDVPMLAFIALAFAAYVRCVMLGITMRRAIALGLAVGFALGTKEAALGAFLGMPFVLLPLRSVEMRGAGGLRSWKAWKPLVTALAVAFLALGAGSGFFVDPERYIAHLHFLTGRLESLSAGETEAVQTFAYTLAGNLDFMRAQIRDLATVLTWPGLIAAAAGLVLLIAKRTRVLLLVVPAATYIVWTFVTLRAAQLRYMLPGAFLLIVTEVALLHALWTSRSRVTRVAGVAAATLIPGILGLRTLDVTHAMLTDTRYAAARWIRDRVEVGDVIEYF